MLKINKYEVLTAVYVLFKNNTHILSGFLNRIHWRNILCLIVI